MTRIKKITLKWYISSNPIKRFLSLFFSHFYVLLFFFKENITIGFKRLHSMKELGLIKNKATVFIDMLFSYIFFGYDPSTYASYCFQNVPLKQRLSFMPKFENALFAMSLNIDGEIGILANKNNTYNLLKDLYGREQIVIKHDSDLDKFLEFIHKHPLIFYKPLDGALGKNVGMVNAQDIDSASFFTSLIKNGAFVIEEFINQCDELSSFHPSSVNSVRLNVLKTQTGTEVLCGCFKCGQRGNIVDNGSAGGIFIPFNIDTGRLYKIGFDENGKRFLKHPDTQIVFDNFQIPRYQDIKSLAIKATEKLPGLRYVGWDIAVSKDKVMIIEGNSSPGIQISEGLFKTGFRKDYRKIARTKIIPESYRIRQNNVTYS